MSAFFTTFLAFFAFGTLGFWLLLALVSIVIISCIENDHYKFPSFLSILLIGIYWKVITGSINGWMLAIVVGSYGMIGIGYALLKWKLRSYKIEDKYKSRFQGTAIPADVYADLTEDLAVYAHKALIVSWIAYWPWSAFWNFLGDFFTMCFDSVRHIFENISKKHLDRFTIVEPPPAPQINPYEEARQPIRRGSYR